jgi:hypothetical protein
MHLKLLVFLLLTPCSFAEEQTTAKTLSDLVFDSPRVEFFRHPSDKEIVAAYSESQPEWWGDMSVFHHGEGKIDWEFKFPAMYEEWHGHYVVSCQWVTLTQIKSPVLELIESTHRGNGSIFLFELQGRELRLLLHTKVRGQLFDDLETFGVPPNGTAHIKGEQLKVTYAKMDRQEPEAVILSGTLEIADLAERKLPDKKYEQKCLWDAEKRMFVPSAPTSP